LATLDNLIDNKLTRINSVPDAFVDATTGTQVELLKEVQTLISELETSGGAFVYSEKNISILESINTRLTSAVFNDEYTSSLTSYISEFEKQADLNNGIFAKQFDGFETIAIYDTIKNNSIKSAVDLFAVDSFASTITKPITEQLNQAIINGGSITDTIKAVNNFIVGTDEVDGVMLNYVKTNAYDAFAIYDRTYSQAVYNELGAEWFVYSGKSRDTSRCFCVERSNKFYHKKEVEAWGRMQDLGECGSGNGWAGMRKGTNENTIFSFVGGYNCDHALMAVSESIVPKDVISRNKKKGNI
jgi:hypothetical protein